MRFWDTSAIVPLLALQSATAEAERWRSEDGEIVLWTLASIEWTSSLWRLVREGAMDVASARSAEAVGADLAGRAFVVLDVDAVKDLAERLLRVHPLRAADAMQLGAALAWAGARPQGRILHTFDRRLALAAAREGFHVVPAPAGAL